MKKILSNEKLLLIPISMKYLNDIDEYSKNPIFFKFFAYSFFKTKTQTLRFKAPRITDVRGTKKCMCVHNNIAKRTQ